MTTEPAAPGPRIAVLIPCFNEERTIGTVVRDFRAALPGAVIHVYDNNSTDGTVAAAREAGAVVGREQRQGKGHVVRRMFADIEADLYVLVDGDDTYAAPAAPRLAGALVRERLDMVNAVRTTAGGAAFRRGHRVGNRVLSKMVGWVFGDRFRDMLSGYKVFSRRFVKSFPALAGGFEIETELAVHALEMNMPTAEIETPYRARPHGSASKLRTLPDGMRILSAVLILIKEERPLQFFSWIFVILMAVSVLLAVPVMETYFHTGLVPRLPTAVLATGIMLLGFLSLTCGLILDTVTRGRRETKRMHYLSIPLFAPGGTPDEAAAQAAAEREDDAGAATRRSGQIEISPSWWSEDRTGRQSPATKRSP
jgi:glycosyltransferase involved in cell wall biosynthesis